MAAAAGKGKGLESGAAGRPQPVVGATTNNTPTTQHPSKPSKWSDLKYHVTAPLSLVAADARTVLARTLPGSFSAGDSSQSSDAFHPSWPLSYARKVAVARQLLDIDRNNHSVERVRGLEKLRDTMIHLTDSLNALSRSTPKTCRWTMRVDRVKLDRLQEQRNGGIVDHRGVLGKPASHVWTLPTEIQDPVSEHTPLAQDRRPDRVASMQVEYVMPASSARRQAGTSSDSNSLKPKLVVFVPGGGLAFGSATSYRPFARELAAMHDAPVLSITYRKPPEHPFPSGVRDVACLLGYLTGSLPSDIFHGSNSLPADLAGAFSPKDILLYSNSAGGGVLLASLLYADHFLPAPPEAREQFLGAILVSPWADLRCTSPTWSSNLTKDFLPHFLRDGVDGMIYKGGSRNPVAGYLEGQGGRRANWYREQQEPRSESPDTGATVSQSTRNHKTDPPELLLSHPLLSPALILPNLASRSFPPLLIISGSRETLLHDAHLLQNLPVPTTHLLFSEMCHDFRMHGGKQASLAGEWEKSWIGELGKEEGMTGKVVVGLDGEVREGRGEEMEEEWKGWAGAGEV